MKNLAFVIWMIGYPVICAGIRIAYFNKLFANWAMFKPTPGATAVACLLEFSTWIYVGVKLYEGIAR